jgi:hypothetical protein
MRSALGYAGKVEIVSQFVYAIKPPRFVAVRIADAIRLAAVHRQGTSVAERGPEGYPKLYFRFAEPAYGQFGTLPNHCPLCFSVHLFPLLVVPDRVYLFLHLPSLSEAFAVAVNERFAIILEHTE